MAFVDHDSTAVMGRPENILISDGLQMLMGPMLSSQAYICAFYGVADPLQHQDSRALYLTFRPGLNPFQDTLVMSPVNIEYQHQSRDMAVNCLEHYQVHQAEKHPVFQCHSQHVEFNNLEELSLHYSTKPHAFCQPCAMHEHYKRLNPESSICLLGKNPGCSINGSVDIGTSTTPTQPFSPSLSLKSADGQVAENENSDEEEIDDELEEGSDDDSEDEEECMPNDGHELLSDPVCQDLCDHGEHWYRACVLHITYLLFPQSWPVRPFWIMTCDGPDL